MLRITVLVEHACPSPFPISVVDMRLHDASLVPRVLLPPLLIIITDDRHHLEEALFASWLGRDDLVRHGHVGLGHARVVWQRRESRVDL